MSLCSNDSSSLAGDGHADANRELRALAREHHAALSAAHASGLQVWGALPLSLPAYAERVVHLTLRRLREEGETRPQARVTEILQRAALTDLFLATACDQDVAGAWQCLHDGFHARLVALARRRRLPGMTGEEVVADVLGSLVAPPAGGQARTRIGTYDGTGSLLGWLSAILLRVLADRSRGAASSLRRTEGSDGLDAAGSRAVAPAAAETPLAAAITAETARALRIALHRIWERLTPQQVLVLLLRFRDGVSQIRIAEMLAVSESRVSRVLASAVDTLRAGLQGPLEALRAADPERMWRTLHDELDLRLQESAPAADRQGKVRLP